MDRLGDILSQKNSSSTNQNSSSPVFSQEPNHLSNEFDRSFPSESVHELHNKMNHENLETNKTFSSQNPELKTLLINIKKDIDRVLMLLDQTQAPAESIPKNTESVKNRLPIQEDKIIEGVFNGVKMIGDDGSEYSVPPNYASKSKLVEGDILKLTINSQGTFIYKQIAPTDRDRVRGTLFYRSEESQWNMVTSTGQSYKILTASVTFYKGKAGSPVVAFVPKNGPSEWAAVEHILQM